MEAVWGALRKPGKKWRVIFKVRFRARPAAAGADGGTRRRACNCSST